MTIKTVIERSRLDVIGIFLLGLVLFTLGTSSQEIIGFESRFYLFALEMWEQGLSWFPTTYHEPYADYPATSTALIYLTASLFGGVDKFTAVFPTAIAASLTLVFTYLTGALHEKRWGLYAVLLMLLTMAFFKSARSLSLDMYPTVITAAVFYCTYSADLKKQPARYVWIFPLLLLGFAFRGPIGLVMPTGVLCVYYLIDKNFKKLVLTGSLALLMLLISTAILLSLAYHVGGEAFMQDVLRMEILGRMEKNVVPRYFYLTHGLTNYAISFPLGILVLIGIAQAAWKNRSLPEMNFLMKLVGWTIIILLGMSIPGDKKVRYILPVAPALALIAAYLFLPTTQIKYFIQLRKIILGLFTILPFLLVLSVAYIANYAHQHAFPVAIPYVKLILFLLILQVVAILIVCCFVKQVQRRTTGLMVVAALTFLTANFFMLEPIEQHIDRAQVLIQQVEAKRLHEKARLAFYKERADGLPIKYLINMKAQETPLFIDQAEALMTLNERAFFVTSETYFEQLPQPIAAKVRVIAKDKLAHVKVVVFTL